MLGKAAKAAYLIGSVSAGVFGVLIAAAGLIEVGLGVYGYLEAILGHGMAAAAVGDLSASIDSHSPASVTIHRALKGLELIFLSPMVFLTLMGVTHFVRAMVNQANAREGTEVKPRIEIGRIKSLVIGLMIAAVATDLTSRILMKEALRYETAVSESIVIVVLAGYVFLLSKLQKSRS